jgi:glutamate/tyrosine decarboxylase-like PLP-dependent enzyme
VSLLEGRQELDGVLALVAREAARYLAEVDELPVRHHWADEAARAFGGSFPEEGAGALAAIKELAAGGPDAAIASAGPRFFHWVIGGVTPAALGADWLAATLDQNAAAWDASPLGTRLEELSIEWLKELFGLPPAWSGVLTTGATMANFVGLAAARQWWGERFDVDIAEEGLGSVAPDLPILTSGYIHASAIKALAMLGIGRRNVHVFARDSAGRVDLTALSAQLAALDPVPAVIVANAGEVNAGDFDPIADLAKLARQHDAWLHVDGAFGLFAGLSSRTSYLLEGIEEADSVISDAHKWLNVPYDCGFAFVRDRSLLTRVFRVTAAYLPPQDDDRPHLAGLGPESSRRSRSLVVWATLRAYGRRGYRELVEHHLDLAQRLARKVDDAPDLERLAEVPLNIVCFRYRPEGVPENELDALNARLGEDVLADGRVYVGTTRYEGRVAFRPAIVNWRTREEDVDLLVEVLRELGQKLVGLEQSRA